MIKVCEWQFIGDLVAHLLMVKGCVSLHGNTALSQDAPAAQPF